MKAFARKPATRDDLRRLPETMVGELVDGELHATPRPAVLHTRASSVLGRDLGSFDRPAGGGGPGGWWLLDEPELHLGEDVLVPDLAGWRRERLPQLPDEPAITVPPDWVCEVLSPGTAALDRVKKMRRYGVHGVSYAWLLDPREQTLEVFRREGGAWLELGAYSHAERVRAEPFEELELDLSRLWER